MTDGARCFYCKKSPCECKELCPYCGYAVPNHNPVCIQLELTTTREIARELVEALGSAKTFMLYARYELEEKHHAFEQFPCQECADKRIVIVDNALARAAGILNAPDSPDSQPPAKSGEADTMPFQGGRV